MNNTRRKQINELAETIRNESNLITPLSLVQLNDFIAELGGTLEYSELNEDTDAIITKINNFTGRSSTEFDTSQSSTNNLFI